MFSQMNVCTNARLEMLDCETIDVSEGIDVNKSNGLHQCIICHYLYFLEVCDASHDLIQKTMSFNDVAIVSVKGMIEFISGTWAKMKP